MRMADCKVLLFFREDEKECGIWIKEVSEITCIGV